MNARCTINGSLISFLKLCLSSTLSQVPLDPAPASCEFVGQTDSAELEELSMLVVPSPEYEGPG